MTPCTYDGFNYQKPWEPFAALDLWWDSGLLTAYRSELDTLVYFQINKSAPDVEELLP